MRRNTCFRAVLAGALIFVLAACSEKTAPPDIDGLEPMDHAGRAAAVLESPDRPAADRADDELRKPAKVLAFIGVEPGMKLFEMEAGSGYYTELFSKLVGPDGSVVMQSPAPFDSFLGTEIDERVYGRLSNVRVSKSNFDALDARSGSVDIVTWMLGPHDLYYSPGGADLGDDEGAFAEVMRILKPGGTFIVLDHAARAGSPESTGGTIHRLDPAIIRALAGGAGLQFAGESDALRHPEDNKDLNVFDPAVRRMTDRVLYKFKKPEEDGSHEN